MSYKHKYSKYKQKFLNLEKQIQDIYPTNSTKYQSLEPTTRNFIISLENQNAPPIYKLPIDEARNILNNLTKSSDKIPANIKDINITISNPHPHNISIRIVRPPNNNNKLLPVVYFHGGGWIMGNKNTHDHLIRKIAVEADVAIIFVSYIPSPEAKYPTQIIEAYDATLYVYENADTLNLDKNKLTIMGDSVGGNMAIAVSLKAKAKGNYPPIKHQILTYPVTDASMSSPSYHEFEFGPWLTKKSMEWFFDAYTEKSDFNKRNDIINNILISPLSASIDQLSGLPPALIISDENDVLRDETEAYAHKLSKVTDVTMVRFLGTTHDFLILEPIKNTPAVRGAILLITSYLKSINV